jgi:hypothetical protein
MKVAITGHTKGLGKAIYDYFIERGDTVYGMSRSNGYNIDNPEMIAAIAKDCDLFINNAYSGLSQSTLLNLLSGKVKIITSGSMGADYPSMGYRLDKLLIQQNHTRLKKLTTVPMLLLKMGYLENHEERPHIKYSTVVNCIDFWLRNLSLSVIEIENHPSIYGSNI